MRLPKSLALIMAILVVALTGADPGWAQRAKPVPQAFAALQAPEAAVEVCHGASAQAALDCARQRCQRKAGRGACFAVTACEPAGWAGTMGVQMSEVHFSNAVCGAPTREAVVAALRAFCEGHAGRKQCTLGQIWSPDGRLHNVEATWTAEDFRK